MATTEICNLSPTWKCPMETLQQGGDGSEKMDLGEDWLVLWTCAGGRASCFSLSLQPQWNTNEQGCNCSAHRAGWSPFPGLCTEPCWELKHLDWDKEDEERCNFFMLFFQMSDRSAGSSFEDLSVANHSLCLPEPLHKHKRLNLLLNQTLLPCWRCSLFLLKRSHMSWISHSCF